MQSIVLLWYRKEYPAPGVPAAGQEFGTVIQWLRAYYLYGMTSRTIRCSRTLRSGGTGRPDISLHQRLESIRFQTIDDLARQIAAVVQQTEVQGIIECCSVSRCAETKLRHLSLKTGTRSSWLTGPSQTGPMIRRPSGATRPRSGRLWRQFLKKDSIDCGNFRSYLTCISSSITRIFPTSGTAISYCGSVVSNQSMPSLRSPLAGWIFSTCPSSMTCSSRIVT